MRAAACMAVIAVAHHTGFIDKAYRVCADIVKCVMCCTMWGTLGVLLLMGCRMFDAVVLAFAAAYFSNWVSLVLGWLSRKYEKIWQRSQRVKRYRRSRNRRR